MGVRMPVSHIVKATRKLRFYLCLLSRPISVESKATSHIGRFRAAGLCYVPPVVRYGGEELTAGFSIPAAHLPMSTYVSKCTRSYVDAQLRSYAERERA